MGTLDRKWDLRITECPPGSSKSVPMNYTCSHTDGRSFGCLTGWHSRAKIGMCYVPLRTRGEIPYVYDEPGVLTGSVVGALQSEAEEFKDTSTNISY